MRTNSRFNGTADIGDADGADPIQKRGRSERGPWMGYKRKEESKTYLSPPPAQVGHETSMLTELGKKIRSQESDTSVVSFKPTQEDVDKILSTSLTDVEPVAKNEDGATRCTVVCLNEAQYKDGFQAPFTLVIGDKFDRTTFHDSVKRFISENGIEDKTLKNKFIAWYCEMFRQPQAAFYSEEGLQASIAKVGETLASAAMARETLIPAKIPVTKGLLEVEDGERNSLRNTGT